MENEIIMEKLDTQAKRQDDMRNQLDKDRADIDQLRMDVSAIKEGQQAQLKQMVDFKEEIRSQIRDVIKEELPKEINKSIKREILLLEKRNPKRVIQRTRSFWEYFSSLFRK